VTETGTDGGWLLHREQVIPDWVDYNGHMNVAYYVLVFDHATDAVFERLGLGQAYIGRKQRSLFVVEQHVLYRAEVLEGADLAVSSRILGFDDKRLHLFHAMYDGDAPEPAAYNELMLVHVDMKSRSSAPFSEDTLAILEAQHAMQKSLPRPRPAGRAIRLPGG